MRQFTLAILLLVLSVSNVAAYQSFEVYEGDTINIIDESGKKQKHWIIFGRASGQSGFSPDEKVEEGPYVDSRKQGLWKKYYPGEKIKSEIVYNRNRPDGPFTTYYENGQIEEKGQWKNRRFIGEFERYYKNGEPHQKFVYDQTGKRNGKQEYYHENGQLEIEVNIVGGKEEGVMRRYYDNGDLKEEKVYAGGVVDPASVKNFESSKPVVEKRDPDLPMKVAKTPVDAKVNKSVSFVPDGYNKLYNRNRQISQDGQFKKGKLYTGKWYKYDDDGILTNIEVYRKGLYAGEAPIEEE